MRLVGAVAGLLLASQAAAANAQNVAPDLRPGEMLLQVEANGESLSRPDVMTITAGVVTTGSTASKALAANSELAERLIAAVRGQGIDPRDVQTTELSVNPVFDNKDNRGDDDIRARIIGYTARNQLQLRLRDLTRASQIIDALFQSGANSVSGPVFSLSDPKPAQREARRHAVDNARLEAETYADAFSMRVARPLRASERGDFGTDGAYNIVVTGSRIPRAPVEPGELTTRINLWVDYALVRK